MAGYIPQEIIDRIIEQTDIVQVVEQYVKLGKKTGLNYFGLCPFHAETKPSFSVTPNKQMFYCYSCQRGGNVINFIQEIENISFPEAVRFLAKMQGIEIPDTNYSNNQNREERVIQQNILLEAARFFYRALESSPGQKAKQYMKNRGYSNETLIRFGIGYADEKWDSLSNHLLEQGFTEEDLINSGIIRRSSHNNLIDLFRNRVIIPIFPSHGKYIIAFGGRTLDDETGPKYLNSPETLLYHKGSNLFGLNLVRQLRPIPDTILLTEGYMDTIALHQAGYTNAVAGLGTALTENQAKLLERYAKTIIIAYDSDSAGIKATLKAIQMFQFLKIEIKVLNFGEAKDPDNYIKVNGKSRFDALIKEAPSALDFRISLAKTDAINQQGDLDINLYASSVCKILAELDSAILIELYAKRLAAEIHISDKTILQDIERYKNNSQEKNKIPVFNYSEKQNIENGIDAKNISENYDYELLFLVLLASFPEIYSKIKNRYHSYLFSHPVLRKLAEKTEIAIQNNQMTTQELLKWSQENDAKEENPKISSDLMKVIFTFEDKKITVTEKIYSDILRKLELNYARNKKNEILITLKDKTLSQENKNQLLEELAKITKLFK